MHKSYEMMTNRGIGFARSMENLNPEIEEHAEALCDEGAFVVPPPTARARWLGVVLAIGFVGLIVIGTRWGVA